MEVTLRLKTISLKNALNLILASNEDLYYRIDRGLIKIHTCSESSEELLLEVYEIGTILNGEARAQGGFWFEPDNLIGLLEMRLGEDEEDGSVELTSSTLIVRERRSAHEKTRELLAHLRGTTKRRAQASKRPAWIDEARAAYSLEILDTMDIESWIEPETLVSVVQNAVGEDAWDDPAWIDSHHQQLIVFQTRAMHDVVRDVLAKLRISRARNLKEAGGG